MISSGVRKNAEFQNYSKRKDKEVEDLRAYASEKIVERLLGVLDNLERGIEAANSTKDFDSLVKGVEMTLSQMKTITEAEAMAQYLQEQHLISTQRILLEDRSTSTELNLKNSKAILKQHQLSPQQPIAIVTSDFHTLRAEAIAHKQGYTNVLMVSAPTPLSIRYNAWLREYFAYLSGWLLNEY